MGEPPQGGRQVATLASQLDRVLPLRRRHGGTGVGAPERWLGVGVRTPGRWLGIGVCLDWTFQDAGKQLMEIIDEDPARGRIPPGGQFCEKIGGIVVLSGDVM